MEFKKKTLETQIIEIFQKISPAITRLIQSETDNANIVINLGKSKSKNKTLQSFKAYLIGKPNFCFSILTKKKLRIQLSLKHHPVQH